jgi:glycosyltransferase involved in cell wall biosynthesis
VNKDNLPKLSVALIVKNNVRFVEKAIKSLFNQNYSNLEFIVIDGGSTDGTLDIIEKYKDKISYFETGKDKNMIDGWKRGLAHSTGDLTTWMSGDDYYIGDILHKVANEYIKDNSLEIISFGRELRGLNGDIIRKTDYKSMLLLPNRKTHIISPAARFYKKGIFDKYNCHPIEFINNEVYWSTDKDYIIRFAIMGVKNIVIPQLGYVYVQHDGSTTFSKNNIITQYRQDIWTVNNIFKDGKRKKLNISQVWKKYLKRKRITCYAIIASVYLKKGKILSAARYFTIGLLYGNVSFLVKFIGKVGGEKY